MTTTTLFTRQDYLDGKCSHREYYAQLVGPHTRNSIPFTKQELTEALSKDENLNSIPLAKWDDISKRLILEISFKKLGDYATLGGLVCVAKEAARQIAESN